MMSKTAWDRRKEEWVDSSPSEHKLALETLINEINVKETADIQKKIRHFMEKVLDSTQKNECCIFLPITSISEKESHQKAFLDYSPTANISISPGSEAQVAHWIRNFIKEKELNNNLRIIHSEKTNYGLIHYKFNKANISKIRFVCVTDMSLSGDEVENYLATVNNFINYFDSSNSKKFEIILILHSISRRALSKINRLPHVESVYFSDFTKNIDDIFWINSHKIKSLEDALINFGTFIDYDAPKGPQKSVIDEPLGYKQTKNLTITDYFIPDNTPKIIWYNNSKILDSAPFFTSRYSLSPERNKNTNKLNIEQISSKINLPLGYKILLNKSKNKSRTFAYSLIILFCLKRWRDQELRVSNFSILFDLSASQTISIINSLKEDGLLTFSLNSASLTDIEDEYNPKLEITTKGLDYLNAKYLKKNSASTRRFSKNTPISLEKNTFLDYYYR